MVLVTVIVVVLLVLVLVLVVLVVFVVVAVDVVVVVVFVDVVRLLVVVVAEVLVLVVVDVVLVVLVVFVVVFVLVVVVVVVLLVVVVVDVVAVVVFVVVVRFVVVDAGPHQILAPRGVKRTCPFLKLHLYSLGVPTRPTWQYATQDASISLLSHVCRTPVAFKSSLIKWLQVIGIGLGSGPVKVPSDLQRIVVVASLPEVTENPPRVVTVHASPVVFPMQSCVNPRLDGTLSTHARPVHTGAATALPSAPA